MALSKGFEIATLGSGLDVNQSNGDVVTIDMTTDVVSEGSSNLYFTISASVPMISTYE